MKPTSRTLDKGKELRLEIVAIFSTEVPSLLPAISAANSLHGKFRKWSPI